MKKTTLAQILKTYDNILWYPSAGADIGVADAFSVNKLCRFIDECECPDCILMTDYRLEPFADQTGYFYSDPPCGNDVRAVYKTDDCVISAFRLRKINGIETGFDQNMVSFSLDEKRLGEYGDVYTADLLIEYKNGRRQITKLIYAVAENTRFLYDYLLKNKIKITFLVRSCYGYGFGGGRSTGTFLRHLLRDLGVKYFADDENIGGGCDVAEKYLTEEQRAYEPELEHVANLSRETDPDDCLFDTGLDDIFRKTGFRGYGDVILYKVK